MTDTRRLLIATVLGISTTLLAGQQNNRGLAVHQGLRTPFGAVARACAATIKRRLAAHDARPAIALSSRGGSQFRRPTGSSRFEGPELLGGETDPITRPGTQREQSLQVVVIGRCEGDSVSSELALPSSDGGSEA
jgi:hypothetical protein